jgi:16S rRNA C1402 (ribose-2'-O) methylase RsmI
MQKLSCRALSRMAEDKSTVTPGHVYFVATPLGNLKDMTIRGDEILRSVDVICAEDTRHTLNLLRHLKIPHKPLISHHEHNHASSIPHIVSLAKSGKSIAVVTDAGTPGISDPGTELAAALAGADVHIHPVPGCAAVAAALSICGFPSSPFTFLGFLPAKGTARNAALSQLAQIKHTVVLYEAPHRIQRTLRDIINHGTAGAPVNSVPVVETKKKGKRASQPTKAAAGTGHGDRLAVCCRELTKLHEQISRGTVAQLLSALQEEEGCVEEDEQLDDNDTNTGLHEGNHGISLDDESASTGGADRDYVGGSIRSKGEFTLVLGPVSSRKGAAEVEAAADKLSQMLEQLRSDGVRRSEAVALCVEMLSLKKSVVYSKALEVADW